MPRKKGSYNKKSRLANSVPGLRNRRKEIRCSDAFIYYLDQAADKLRMSESDVLHTALKCYLQSSAYWIQGEDFRKMNEEL